MWLQAGSIKTGWRNATLSFRNFTLIWPKHLNKILYTWPSLSRGYQTITIMILHCCCLMAPGKRRYGAGTETIQFVFFLVKKCLNILRFSESWNCMPGLVQILKLLVFKRDCYFWRYNAHILTLCLRTIKNLWIHRF